MKDYYRAYACPKCKESLDINENVLVCANNHSFDIAKEGYVNLILANKKNSLQSGDTKEMIKARDKFLQTGHYDFLLKSIFKLASKSRKFKNILEVGCGSGFYLNALNEYIKPDLALGSDVSKEAMKFSSKKYKDCYFSVDNSFDFNFKNEFFDLVISIFSPFDNAELERIIAKSGLFILVRPGKNHLTELYDLIGMPKKEKTYPEFTNLKSIKTIEVSQKNKITQEDLNSLIEMSPLFWKIKNIDIKDINLPEITFDFWVNVYEKI